MLGSVKKKGLSLFLEVANVIKEISDKKQKENAHKVWDLSLGQGTSRSCEHKDAG